MYAIEMKKFSKNYGKTLVIENINLKVRQGIIMGFVGKNGAGKSTTIRSMLNIISPTSGSINILGLDCVNDAKLVKEKVSYIPSESSFYDNITVKKLLEFAIEFSKSTKVDIEKMCKYFEVDSSKKISELSLGNRKKVSIIQGFLKNSDIMILDEPTSGLDPLMQEKFFRLLLQEKKRGKTIFLSSHNLTEIEKYCDEVIIIKNGKIIENLNMRDLKQKKKQIIYIKTKQGTEESYTIDEDINNVIKKLSKLDIEHLEIKNKSIEEEFISYYNGGEDE